MRKENIILEEKMSKRSILFILAIMLLTVLTLTTGCPEIEDLLGATFEVTTSADKVTVTFSKKINSITMPNTIELETGTFSFDLYKDDVKVGNYGLLSSDDYSFTIVMLGQTSSTISGTYELRIYTGTETNPSVVAEEEVTFPAWSTTARYIDIFDTNYIRLQMVTSFDSNPDPDITDPVLATETFVKSDFTVFDGDGNNVSFTFDSYTPSEELYPSEYSLVFSGLGKFWIRFYKTGYMPVSTHINR
jgi:hypothetical protein